MRACGGRSLSSTSSTRWLLRAGSTTPATGWTAAEADWNSATGGHGHYIPLHGGYHAIPPKDQLFNLRTEMALQLEAMGVPVKYHHHEVGGPGQSEIETPMMGLVAAGDAPCWSSM